MSFQCERQVYFQDCDLAGIVFYPRYVEMVDEAVEDWLRQIGAWDYPRGGACVSDQPHIVGAEVDFQRPSQLGDRLRIALELREVDEWRVRLDVAVHCGGEQRLQIKLELGWAEKGQPTDQIKLPGSILQVLTAKLNP